MPPTPSLARTLVATCFGTAIEWYDFSVFGQLTPILSQVFFPNAAAQKLQIWGIFAVSFLARPLGALLFGHLADTKGRGVCLLATMLTCGIPTVLIGLLPAYKQIGIAAAVLLAVLRFIQGLSVGGEFGAAMVYMQEVSPPGYKSLAGALGYVALGVGMILGNVVTLAVVSATSAEDMLQWGWRVPFLVAFLSVEAAIVLRWNLMESLEFNASKQQLNEEHQLRQGLQEQASGPRALRKSNSSREYQLRPGLQRQASGSRAMRKSNSSKDLEMQRQQREARAGSSDTLAHAAKDLEVAVSEPEQAVTAQYVPIVVVFRSHWRALLLHIFAQSSSGTLFYVSTSWLATFFVRLGTPERTTLYMNVTGLAIMTAIAPVSGWLADRGMGRITGSAIATVIWSCSAVPMFYGLSLGNRAVQWLVHNLMLALLGFLVGLLPSSYSLLYPAGVRLSGFNMAFSLCLIPFGGAVPLIMTAVQTSTGSLFILPGVYVAAWGLVSTVAHLVIMKLYPDVNKSSGSRSRLRHGLLS